MARWHRNETFQERISRRCDGCGLSLVDEPSRARCVYGCRAWYHRPSSLLHPDCAEVHAKKCPVVAKLAADRAGT